jgi:autotransporter-associated beta strand protein
MITGNGSVTQLSGQTTLNAANTYLGGTKLQGGVLQINSDAAINNGVGGIQFNGGVLQFGGYTSNLSFNNSNTTGSVSLASSGNSTLNGSINTTGNFTYSGGGTLTLAGTLNYTGATNIQQTGTLILGAAANLPTNTALSLGDASNNSPTLDLNGHSITVSSLTSLGTSSPTIINNSTATNSTITLNGGATANTFAGNIQDGNNTKTVALTINSGSLTLTNSNNYSGNTTIGTGATLSLSNGTVTGSIPNTARLTLGGGTFATGGSGQNMPNTKLNLTASSMIDLGNGNGTLQFNNSSDQAWNSSAYLRISNWSGNLTGGGTDQFKVGVGGLTAAQLSHIHFTGYVTGASILPISDSNAGEVVPLTALKIGDVNQDGSVSVADISALMTALTDPATYLTNHPALVDSLTVTDLLDVNGDGKDTNGDIQALITNIADNGGNPSLTAVPEPTGLVLLAIGGICILAAVRGRKFPATA